MGSDPIFPIGVFDSGVGGLSILRALRAGLPIVGVEPALKPATALSRTRRIGVMATRGTLASAKFRTLLDSLKTQAEFVLQACDGLADAIENDDAARTIALCEAYVGALGRFGERPGEIDTLVLGCTHYPFAQEQLRALVGPPVHLVETGGAVARQTRRLLDTAGRLKATGAGSVCLLSTGDLDLLRRSAARWLEAPPLRHGS